MQSKTEYVFLFIHFAKSFFWISLGTLVVSTYVGCPDIRDTVTPDLKCPGGQGSILWVTLGSGKHRLGGSALAQCFKQVGDEVPDLDDPSHLVIVFNIVQKLLTGEILSFLKLTDFAALFLFLPFLFICFPFSVALSILLVFISLVKQNKQKKCSFVRKEQ